MPNKKFAEALEYFSQFFLSYDFYRINERRCLEIVPPSGSFFIFDNCRAISSPNYRRNHKQNRPCSLSEKLEKLTYTKIQSI